MELLSCFIQSWVKMISRLQRSSFLIKSVRKIEINVELAVFVSVLVLFKIAVFS